MLFYRYGDRSPSSIPARIFGIVWTLTGLVIIGILVGAIASSLTSVNVQKDITLYGTKVSSYRSAFKFAWKLSIHHVDNFNVIFSILENYRIRMKLYIIVDIDIVYCLLIHNNDTAKTVIMKMRATAN